MRSELTIFICTKDRPRELATALESIRRGSVEPTQILVSDDSPDGTETKAIALKYGARYQTGPQRGLGANRNACVRSLQTDLCAFIDDDVVVTPDFVDRASSVKVDQITTGWELNFSSGTPRRVYSRNASFLGFQQVVPFGRRESVVINATVIPRRAFESVRFAEQTRYGYEEIDFARHVVALGWEIVQDDSLWVEHHPSTQGRDEYRSELDVSRLYLTRYAYSVYEQKPGKAHIFALVAAGHVLLTALRNRRSLRQAIGTISRAAGAYSSLVALESEK